MDTWKIEQLLEKIVARLDTLTTNSSKSGIAYGNFCIEHKPIMKP